MAYITSLEIPEKRNMYVLAQLMIYLGCSHRNGFEAWLIFGDVGPNLQTTLYFWQLRCFDLVKYQCTA